MMPQAGINGLRIIATMIRLGRSSRAWFRSP